MLSVHQALAHCLADIPDPIGETVEIWHALGRVLAEDVTAPSPLPPWDNSAMDGYAVRSCDLVELHPTDGDCCDDGITPHADHVVLQIIDTIPAGTVSAQVVGAGDCARIMTGAPMPDGADAVVMQEYTKAVDGHNDRIQILAGAITGQHVRRRGAEVNRGDTVLHTGHQLTPPSVGLCAAVGRAEVRVARQPRVAIVSTGDEIVPPGKQLGPGQIHSSNTHALAGWIRAAGAIPVDCGIAPDTVAGTRAAFRRAMDADVIVSTGGVSVGDFDVVRQALREEGAEMRFWRVKIKPGKPLAFGVIGGRPAFGLPGNPSSCQVGFLQFVRPFLRMFMGAEKPYLPCIDARWAQMMTKRAGRAELVRVALRWVDGSFQAVRTSSQSSGQQMSMVMAHGLALMPPESTGANKGDSVRVQLMSDVFGGAETPDYPW
jgi:molybdopterin molybdotransferase